MSLRVDNEYYTNAFDFYNGKAKQIDEQIEKFKLICDTLFSNVNFGVQLDNILAGKATMFVGQAKDALQRLMNRVATCTEDFLDGVENNDSLT